MRTYNGYLIPETIDHEELRYLVSIGSKVLVNFNHRFMGNIIVELVPDSDVQTNSDFSPLSNSDVNYLKNEDNSYYKLYYIG